MKRHLLSAADLTRDDADAVVAADLAVPPEMAALAAAEPRLTLAVADLGDDGVPLLLEHLLQIEADQRLVLGDEHAARSRRAHAQQGIEPRSAGPGHYTRRALGPGSPTAEAMCSNHIQCGFESHPGHRGAVRRAQLRR